MIQAVLQEKPVILCSVICRGFCVFVNPFEDITNKPKYFSVGVLTPSSGERTDYTMGIFHNFFHKIFQSIYSLKYNYILKYEILINI